MYYKGGQYEDHDGDVERISPRLGGCPKLSKLLVACRLLQENMMVAMKRARVVIMFLMLIFLIDSRKTCDMSIAQFTIFIEQ